MSVFRELRDIQEVTDPEEIERARRKREEAIEELETREYAPVPENVSTEMTESRELPQYIPPTPDTRRRANRIRDYAMRVGGRTQDRLRAVLSYSASQDPEMEMRVRRILENHPDYNATYVRQNIDRLEQIEKRDSKDLDKIIRQSPELVRMMHEDPQTGALIFDKDLEKLSLLEWVGKAGVGEALKGEAQLEYGVIGAITREGFGTPEMQERAERLKRRQEKVFVDPLAEGIHWRDLLMPFTQDISRLAGLGERAETQFKRIWTKGIQMMPFSLGAIAAGSAPAAAAALTPIPIDDVIAWAAGGVLAFGFSSTIEGGTIYLDTINMVGPNGERVDPDVAYRSSHLTGAAIGALELIPTGATFRALGGRNVWKRIAGTSIKKAMLREGWQEAVKRYGIGHAGMIVTEIPVEIAQEVLQIAQETYVKERTSPEWQTSTLEENLARVWDIALSTFEGTILTGAVFGGFGATVTDPINIRRQQRRAAINKARLSMYSDIAEAVEIRKKLPAVHRHLLEQTMEKDGASNDVFVPFQEFVEAVEALNKKRKGTHQAVSPRDAWKEIMGSTDQFDEASNLGGRGDLVIPLSQWLTKLSGTEMEAALMNHTKLYQEDSTIAELQAATEEVNEAIEQTFDKKVEEVLALEGEEAAQQIEKDVAGLDENERRAYNALWPEALRATGSEIQAHVAAMVHGKVLGTQIQRSGREAAAMIRAYKVRMAKLLRPQPTSTPMGKAMVRYDEEAREVVHGLRTGNQMAATKAAKLVATQLARGATIVAAPDMTGANMALARELEHMGYKHWTPGEDLVVPETEEIQAMKDRAEEIESRLATDMTAQGVGVLQKDVLPADERRALWREMVDLQGRIAEAQHPVPKVREAPKGAVVIDAVRTSGARIASMMRGLPDSTYIAYAQHTGEMDSLQQPPSESSVESVERYYQTSAYQYRVGEVEEDVRNLPLGHVEIELEKALQRARRAGKTLTSRMLARLPGAPRARKGKAKTLDRNVKARDWDYLVKAAEEALEDRAAMRWYQDFGEGLADLVGQANLQEAAIIFGITSQQNSVEQNLSDTLHVMAIARQIDPVTQWNEFGAALLGPNAIKKKDGTKLKVTGRQVEMIIKAYTTGTFKTTAGMGLKVSTYMNTVRVAGLNEFTPYTVQDVHMARLFGFNYRDIDKKSGTERDAASFRRSNQIRYAMWLTTALAEQFGVQPREMQAALWFWSRKNLSPAKGTGKQRAGTWKSAVTRSRREIETIKEMVAEGSFDKENSLTAALSSADPPSFKSEHAEPWDTLTFTEALKERAEARGPAILVSTKPGNARGFGFPEGTSLEALMSYNEAILNGITDGDGQIKFLRAAGIPHVARVTIGTWEGAEPTIEIKLPGASLETAAQVGEVMGHALLQDAIVTGQPKYDGQQFGVRVTKPDGSKFTTDEILELYKKVNPEAKADGINFTVDGDRSGVRFLDGSFFEADQYGDEQLEAFAGTLAAAVGEGYGYEFFAQEGDYVDLSGKSESDLQATWDRGGLAGRPDLQRVAVRELYQPIWRAYLRHRFKVGAGPYFAKEGPLPPLQQVAPGFGRDPETDALWNAKSGLPIGNDGLVPLTHWSHESGLESIEPEFFGTDIANATERARVDAGAPRRTFFGVPGYKRERGLGQHRYFVRISPSEVYDIIEDPLGLAQKHAGKDQQTIYRDIETDIQDLGYKGYWNKDASIVAIFDSVQVEGEVLDSDVTQKGTRASSGYDIMGSPDPIAVTRTDEAEQLALFQESAQQAAQPTRDFGSIAKAAAPTQELASLNYTMNRLSDYSFEILATDDMGRMVGDVTFVLPTVVRPGEGQLLPEQVLVLPVAQRKGLASYMYRLAEEVTGFGIRHGKTQTEAGQKFRAKRRFRKLQIPQIRPVRPGIVTEAEELDRLEQPKLPEEENMPRGAYLMSRGGTEAMIELFKASDPTTPLHEMGHFYFDMLSDLYESDGASKQVKKDYESLISFVERKTPKEYPDGTARPKITSRADMKAVQREFARQGASEKGPMEVYAKAWETYLFEGRAPSVELQGIFSQIRKWMLEVYENISGLIEISDEVRGVFDRMLASDREIEAAHAQLALQPMERLKDQMTRREVEAYIAASERHKEASRGRLRSRLLRDQKMQREEWWQEEKARVTEKVEAELSRDPLMRLLRYLTNASMHGFEKLPGSLKDAQGRPLRISLDALIEGWGKDVVDEIPSRQRTRNEKDPYIYQRDLKVSVFPAVTSKAERGLLGQNASPEYIAKSFGFDSADAMVQALRRAPRYNEILEKEVNRQLDVRFGNLMKNDDAMVLASFDAVQGPDAIKFLLSELRFIRRQLDPTLAQTRRQFDPSVIRRKAALEVLSVQHKDLDPIKHQRQAEKHARECRRLLEKGDLGGAYDEKLYQTIHMAMYRATKKAKERGVKHMEKLRKAAKKGPLRDKLAKADRADAIRAEKEGRKRSGGFVAMLDAYLAQFSVKKMTKRQLADINYLREWQDQRIAEGRDVMIDPDVLSQIGEKNVMELTVEELETVTDAIDNLSALADAMIKIGDEDFDAVVDKLITGMKANMRAVYEVSSDPADRIGTRRARAANAFRLGKSGLMKIEEYIRRLDGGDVMGPWFTYFWDPLVQAQADASDRTQEIGAKLREVVRRAGAKRVARLFDPKNTYINALGRSVSRQFMVAVALNYGSESNREALLTAKYPEFGNRWGSEAIAEILSKLTETEVQLVNDIWAVIEPLWPEIAAQEVKLHGIAPKHVAPTPAYITLEDGTTVKLNGGYVPLVYNKDLNPKVNRRADESLHDPDIARAVMPHSWTNERVKGHGLPVLLDMRNFIWHMESVTLDLAYRERLLQLDKILNDPDIYIEMQRHLGLEATQQFQKLLQDIAKNGRNSPHRGGWEKFASMIRRNVNLAILSFKTTTVMNNFGNYVTVLDGVRPDYLSRATAEFYNDQIRMGAIRDQIKKKSREMRHRFSNFDRDVRESHEAMLGKYGAFEQVKRFSFSAMYFTDAMIAYPAWLAAYQQALDGNVDTVRGGSEEAAVKWADHVIRTRLSAGALKDLAAIQRGSEAEKQLTMFYTWMSGFFNRAMALGYDINESRVAKSMIRNSPYFLGRLFAMIAGGAIIAEYLSGRGPDDDEPWWQWAMIETLMYGMGAVPIARDIAFGVERAMKGERAQPARAIPAVMVADEMWQGLSAFYKAINHEDTDDILSAGVDLYEALGMAFGVPGTSQSAKTFDFFIAVMSRDEDPENIVNWLRGIGYGRSYDQPEGRRREQRRGGGRARGEQRR